MCQLHVALMLESREAVCGLIFTTKDTNNIACAHSQKRTTRQSAASGIDAVGAGELLPGATHMNTEVLWKCGMMLWQNERSAAAKSMRSRQAAIGNGRAWSGIIPSTSRTCCKPECIASFGSGRKLCILKCYNWQFETLA